MEKRIYLMPTLVLVLVLAHMPGPGYPVHVQAEVLERHAPIIGNMTLTLEELQRILGELMNQSLPQNLEEILRSMNSSLAEGNQASYEEAARKLQDLLANYSEQGPGMQLKVNPATLEKLALLASTRMSGERTEADLNLYAELLKMLVDSGLLGETSPFGEEISIEDVEKSLSDMGLEPGRAEETKTPLGTGKKPPLSLSGPKISPQPPKLQGPSMHELIIPALIILMLAAAGYLAYAGRGRLRAFALKAGGIIIAGGKTLGIGKPKNPREAIIKCFENLVAVLSFKGYPKERWETAREYASRILDKDLREAVLKAAALYERAKFSLWEPSWEDAESCSSCIREVAGK